MLEEQITLFLVKLVEDPLPFLVLVSERLVPNPVISICSFQHCPRRCHLGRKYTIPGQNSEDFSFVPYFLDF